jgi:signal transduction histidine kinase
MLSLAPVLAVVIVLAYALLKVAERTRALTEANRSLERAQAERQLLLDRTVEVTEAERSRFASSLHDGPIQVLAGVRMMLDRLEMRLERGDVETALLLLSSAQDTMEQEIHGLRRLMSELRPPILDERGLAAALRDLASDFTGRTGIECDVEVAGDTRRELDTILYRVVQEAQSNVAKHAGATRMSIRLGAADGHLQLAVSDDGRGFTPVPEAELLRGRHFGLAGMHDRIRRAGGRLEVDSKPGAGTELRAWIPLEAAA